MMWRVIPNMDNRYEVSTTGSVRTLSKNHSNRILTPHSQQDRLSVNLTFGQHVYSYFIDDLVARTFLPSHWFEYCEIIHKDGNLCNNVVDNLICADAVPDLSGESWEDVTGLEGVIKVSTLGRVKRIDKKPHLYKFYTDFNGYQTFGFTVNQVTYSYRVHRLVAQTFIPNPYGKPEVNHINGNKSDNRAINLEWCTKHENMQHAVITRLCTNTSPRMKNVNRQLRSTSIMCIETGQIFESIDSAAKFYGVSWGTVADIVHGRTSCSKQLPHTHFSILKKGDKTK